MIKLTWSSRERLLSSSAAVAPRFITILFHARSGDAALESQVQGRSWLTAFSASSHWNEKLH